MKYDRPVNIGISANTPAVKAAHTPTPWITYGWANSKEIGIQPLKDDGSIGPVVEPGQVHPDDAAHIVKCVNSHQELIGLLKAILPFVSIAGHQINGKSAFDVIKQAIAQAEGR